MCNRTLLCRLIGYAFLLGTFSLFNHGITYAGGVGEPTGKMAPVTADETTSIGQVAWEVTETSTGKVLAKGERLIRMNEVQVIEGRDDYLEQRLPLSGGFYLKLNSGREAEPFSGFGITAGKEDQFTFSWEWFHVEKPHFARKIQEEGELEFDAMQVGDLYEITRLRFLTDISLRVRDYESAGVSGKTEPEWRVKILKNSEITWPTIADGKVRTAADAAAWRKANPPPAGFWSTLVKIAAKETTKSGSLISD